MNPISTPSSDILTFNEALNLAGNKKHLLLGNGFSIALKPDIFSYSSLFEECKKSKCITKEIASLFNKFKTNDFEVIIKALNDSSKVLSIYSGPEKKIKQLKSDATKLKKVLVRLLSSKHPEHPNSISDNQYVSCIDFLSHFDRTFTLNYDLLLYWVIMKALEQKEAKHRFDDGFRHEENADYVIWSPEDSDHQNIYYLHGALHLFDIGAEVKKITWVNTHIKLITQIRSELEHNNFPLFVAEGTSNEKMTKINHSQYLGKGLRGFAKIGGSLFIHGHSLANSDEHILELIIQNNITKLFVSLHDDNAQNKKKANNVIRQAAEAITNSRVRHNKNKPIELFFYDAESAHVWNKK